MLAKHSHFHNIRHLPCLMFLNATEILLFNQTINITLHFIIYFFFVLGSS